MTDMKKQLSDEQLEALMQTLVKDASADESLLDDIANAPQLWWSIQRNIGETRSHKRPLLSAIVKKWLMIGVPVAAAALLIVGIFSFRPADEAKTDLAGLQQNGVKQTEEAPVEIIPEPAVPVKNIIEVNLTKPNLALPRKQNSTRVATAVAERRAKRASTTSAEKTEIKSEFIALSNVGNPESGQVVRVKVPSSLMVTLGLVQSVEKPSNLIDAEVVVGDDGLNRAIRFIRQ